jgi:hypothetical protein
MNGWMDVLRVHYSELWFFFSFCLFLSKLDAVKLGVDS